MLAGSKHLNFESSSDEDKNNIGPQHSLLNDPAAEDAAFASTAGNGALTAVGASQEGSASAASLGTISQLAQYLYQGYFSWDGENSTVHWWATTPVTVNISGLTAAEQNLARLALADWSRVCNISFSFTTGAADITYNHNGSGIANTNWNYDASGHMTSATVDISSDWWPNDDLNSYMMQTYIHETGHAIGLGHQGPYNNTATYGVDNVFTNDTWQWSVMSYFDQSNYAGNSPRASYDYVVTPEMADISAVQHLYGAPVSSTGGRTYGFHSTAGTPFDFTAYSGTPAFTIYNTGGNNTLDASGYSVNQVLDATPGHWSSIGGYTDNIGIYLTTNINNVVGGSSDDLIIPNPNLTGTLTGGGGHDTFQSPLGLSSYTITDISAGDRINFTDANLATLSCFETGTDLTYAVNGGTAYSLTLSNNPAGHFYYGVDATYGGADLDFKKGIVGDDLDGDHHSDILWRADDGTVASWTLHNSGSNFAGAYTHTGANLGVGAVTSNWHLTNTGDFNGDGKNDILWRDEGGELVSWDMNGLNYTGFDFGHVDTAFQTAGIGDFNGDGKSDILWHNTSNSHYITWDMNDHSYSGFDFGAVGNSWQVAGTGDFSNHGESDILWRDNTGEVVVWQMNNHSHTGFDVGHVDLGWMVVGIGDFAGNGHSDILWRSNTGELVSWDMQSPTSHVGFDLGHVDLSWNVAGIGDFNGDGRSDILWRDNSGDVVAWNMNDHTHTSFDFGHVDTSWHIQA
ncbi:hypothetical protein BSN85_08755 [Bradyrhizobium brasilense]|uniref:M10 family metallopeptidase C-terminal domain-containing protein n=1 Tax=Bradyrhizobium brasilense TaxID=1419277 RepID=UPI0009785660|nr:M10 family metallopeptidase C-terminal domain-containing protein [Bradyrhizobium brasilense]OMI12920.1 hypothetical protein BSN85_08755 [Bradyrhizobium brasilense]